MANAISIISGPSQHVYVTLQVEEGTVDQVNNTSTVNWALKMWLEAAQSSYWYSMSYHAISVVINGQTVYSRSATSNEIIGVGTTHATEATAVTIASGSLTVAHNTDGSKTIAASYNVNYRWSGGIQVSNSGSLALTTIPRASTISAPTFTMGTSGTITIKKANSSFKHTLMYSWGDTSDTGINSGKGYKGTITEKTSDSSVYWTPPLQLAKVIPSATQGQGTLICYTYNGDTQVGESAITFTATVPSSKAAPFLDVTLSRVRTNNTAITGYIQSVDRVKVVLDAEALYGATIRSYSTTIGDTGYSGSTVTSNILSSSGTIKIKATVTDSRGYSYTVNKSITVTAYTAPQLTGLSAYRCASSASTTYSASGAYICAKPLGSVTSLSSKNTVKCTVYYKKASESSWGSSVSVSDTSSDYTFSGEYVIFAADTTSAYDVKVTLVDAFNSVTYIGKQVPTINAFISILKSGTEKVSMAIGKVAEVSHRFALGWGLTVNAESFKDSGGSDIYVKNSDNVGVKIEETSSSTAIGLFARSSGEHGLWDYSTNYFLLYGNGGVLYLPQAVSGLTSNEVTWLKGGNYVAACNAEGGTSGYLHLCRITVASAWQSEPFIFDVVERFKGYTGHIAIRFTNVESTDPDIDTFSIWGGISDAYVVHSGTGTFDIYISKSFTYTADTITAVHRNYGNTKDATITYYDEQVSAIPGSYTKAFRLCIEGSNSKELSFLDDTIKMTCSSSETTLTVTGGVELYNTSPYLDFHYGKSTADYTARIIEASKGVLTAYNSIASGSDERLKEDITDIPDAYMELVERLEGKTFHMRLMEDGTRSCGFVAQDVLAIEKELGITQSVLVRNSGEELDATDTDGNPLIAYYSIDYQAYAVLLGEYYRRKLEKINARLEALEGSSK